MDLSPLLQELGAVPPLTEVFARLDARAPVTLGLIDASKAVTAALLWRRQRAPVLLVVPREVDAEAMAEQVRAWAGDAAVHFPARGTLPYARELPNTDVTTQRLSVLSRLAHATSGGAQPLVIASAAAVVEHTLRPADLGRGPGIIEVGSAPAARHAGGPRWSRPATASSRSSRGRARPPAVAASSMCSRRMPPCRCGSSGSAATSSRSGRSTSRRSGRWRNSTAS